jgi:hypothetical protein
MNRKLLPGLIFAFTLPAIAQVVPPPEAPVGGPAKPESGAIHQEAKPTGASRGNAWFEVSDQDLGTYFNHEEAVGHFMFKNPNDQAVEWKTLTASCQCSRAVILIGKRRYEYSNKPTPNMLVRVTQDTSGRHEERVSQIEIEPKEAGEVEVHMEMQAANGTKSASLDIHTTDSITPMTKLSWRATGAQMFVVSPPDVNLNQMTWNEKREFSVTVTSPIQRDFTITHMDDAGKDFDVKYDKVVKDGAAVYTIHGTYGPVTAEGNSGGGVLKFYTDMKGDPTFLVRVQAIVTGPMDLKPGSFLGLGMIHKGSGRTEKVTITPNDGSDLQATEIAFEGLSVESKYVTTHQSKVGKDLVIELEVAKDVPTGLLKGSMLVKLNHPAVKERKITFNGFVR